VQVSYLNFFFAVVTRIVCRGGTTVETLSTFETFCKSDFVLRPSLQRYLCHE
jgi:hypothetical protein